MTGRFLVWLCGVAITLGGCTTPDPLYCDAEKPCEDAALVCNQTNNTCEAKKDSGGPDALDPDGPAKDLVVPDAPVSDRGVDLAPPDQGQDLAVDALPPDAPQPHCGDGKVNGSELCDKADLGGKTCKALGYASGTLACKKDCTFDTSKCVAPAKCGDGKINDTGEQCDKTALGGKTCKTQGFAGGTLTCSSSCKLDTATCYKCGDKKINGTEVCDGVLLNGKTCKTQGYWSGTLSCKPDCTAYDTNKCHHCGNGVLNSGEKCDSAALGGKSCGGLGFDGGALACKSDCTFDTSKCHKCGDGKVNGPEQCDGAQLAGKTCKSAGLDGGTVKCKSNCTLDTTGCYRNWTMAAGSGHACGLDTAGKLWCWGNGSLIGNGTTSSTTNFNKPQAILSGVKQVSVGYEHTCVLLTDGSLRCWGINTVGQLGDGTTKTRSTPAKVGSNLKTWVSVSASFTHTCAVKINGTLWCWGYNNHGQLGDSTKQTRHTPTQVGTANAWKSVSAGGYANYGGPHFSDHGLR